MGDYNTPEAAIIGSDMTGDIAAAYEAAATLASLISAPVSTSDCEDMTCTDEPLEQNLYNEPDKTNKKYVISYEKDSTTGTRKFTREDDINLIRGIIKFGRSSWKKIWKDTPELQHIKHSALKDRGRSKRFSTALEKAMKDPSLLDRPEKLLGDVHSFWYKNKSNEKNDTNDEAVQGRNQPSIEVGATKRKSPKIEAGSSRKKRGGRAKEVEPPVEVGGGAKPLFMSGPMQGGHKPTIVSVAAHCDSGSYPIHMAAAKMMTDAARETTRRSGAATRATSKRSAMVKTEGNYNKRPKLKQEAKPTPRKNNKGLRTLQNGEVDEFPGWTCKKIQRKNSPHYDRLWSHKSLDGVNVRSRVGMREMMEKMERHRVNPKTAYEILMNEGKTKYFKRTGSMS